MTGPSQRSPELSLRGVLIQRDETFRGGVDALAVAREEQVELQSAECADHGGGHRPCLLS
jgi:hypothetical protein